MRALTALPTLVITIALGIQPLAAQPAKLPPSTIAPPAQPNLPFPAALADTVIVSSFSLANGATFASGGPLTLDHRLVGGVVPTQFRASKFADFRDATWKPYVATVPTFGGPNSGVCASTGSTSANAVRMVAHFQVRGPKPSTTKLFVHSNVARDTTCLLISG